MNVPVVNGLRTQLQINGCFDVIKGIARRGHATLSVVVARIGQAARDAFIMINAFFAKVYDVIRNDLEKRCFPIRMEMRFDRCPPLQLHFGRDPGLIAHRPFVRDPMPDVPVNIPAIIEDFRNGEEPQLSRNMTARNFIELVDQLSDKKMKIAMLAKKWAETKPLKIDPTHRFFEIFQEAFRLKGQIRGGEGMPDDYATYACSDEQYYSHGPHFRYVIYSLLGFQEMERADNLELMRKLDNGSMRSGTNPGYIYQRAISRIFGYPLASSGATDIREKIHACIGAVWEAYQAGKINNKLLDFFRDGFKIGDYCFDIRISRLQEFTLANRLGDFEEFSVKLNHTDGTNKKIAEHWRVFKNKQLKVYAQAHLQPGEEITAKYRDVKRRHELLPNNPEFLRDFEPNYLKHDQFAAYLAAEGDPIREKTFIPAGADGELIWRADNIWFDPNKAFLEVPERAIDAAQRVVGKVIGIQNNDWNEGQIVQAKIHQLLPHKGTIRLDLRGDPIARERWVQGLTEMGI